MDSRERRRQQREAALNRQRSHYQRKKKVYPMKHFVQIGIEIKTHDDNSMLANQANPLGPLVSITNKVFLSIGNDLEDTVADCHNKVVEFLSSNGPAAGLSEKPKILAPFQRNIRQQGLVGSGEGDAAKDLKKD